MFNCRYAKLETSKLNLADITHKFWLWCTVDRNLLNSTLKMLNTFTFQCDQGN